MLAEPSSRYSRRRFISSSPRAIVAVSLRDARPSAVSARSMASAVIPVNLVDVEMLSLLTLVVHRKDTERVRHEINYFQHFFGGTRGGTIARMRPNHPSSPRGRLERIRREVRMGAHAPTL